MADDQQADSAEIYRNAITALAESLSTVSKAYQTRVDSLVPLGHLTIIVVAAARLDDELGRCLKVTFRKLSNTIEDRIFNRPLQDFAHKIDIAYALSITNDEMHEELRKILAIRNEFAHTRKFRTLETKDIAGLRKYPRQGDKALEIFMGVVSAINDHLEQYLVARGVTDDISATNLPKQE